MLGFFLLATTLGVLSASLGTFPYEPLLRRPLQTLQSPAIRTRLPSLVSRGPGRSRYWRRSETSAENFGGVRGTTSSDELTLVASAAESAAHLVGPDGKVVHSWKKPFSASWPEPEHVAWPVSDERVAWTAVELGADGDLYAVYQADREFPVGYGVVKLNADSDVVWRYPGRCHRDVEVQRNGHVLTLAHDYAPRPPVLDGDAASSRVLIDAIVRLSSEGRQLERISLLEAFRRSEYHTALGRWQDGESEWDPIRTTDVERIGRDFAEHHEDAEPGDLLVSMASLNAVGWIDPETPEFVRLVRGPWLHQHDVDPMTNGHLLIFDNEGGATSKGGARVLEYDPATHEVVWSYEGSSSQPLRSRWGGEQMRLSNGNVLVASSTQGRVLEVDGSGTVVWEYQLPARRESGGREYLGALGLHQLDRVPRSRLDFLGDEARE